MYKKTMREALKEARAYRDPIDEGITGNIQKAITIAKKMGGNMTGAVKEIEKIARGLSDDPSVRAALRTANEELEEASKYLRYSDLLIQKGRMQAAKDKQGEKQTDREIEKEKKKLGITDEFVPEADLSKSQVKMVHKKADDMPKKDFIKRYGKDGDSVRYATATNMVKKQLGIEEEEFVPEL